MKDQVLASPVDFVPEIESFLATTSLNLNARNLELPGHHPISWPMQRHLEQSVILLLCFLIERLRPRVFFDVGSAAGDFSIIAASRSEYAPFVHAFDMRSDALTTLKERVTRTGLGRLVTAHQTGLSDHHEGEKDIWFARTRLFEREPAAGQYEEPWWVRLRAFLKGKDRGLVKSRALVTSIDCFVSEQGVVPDLLKIDVDGYEIKVLRGGIQTFEKRRPPVMLELHKDKLMVEGKRADAISLLLDIGYKALFMTDHHNCRSCRLIEVNTNHPFVTRQETDFVLFV